MSRLQLSKQRKRGQRSLAGSGPAGAALLMQPLSPFMVAFRSAKGHKSCLHHALSRSETRHNLPAAALRVFRTNEALSLFSLRLSRSEVAHGVITAVVTRRVPRNRHQYGTTDPTIATQPGLRIIAGAGSESHRARRWSVKVIAADRRRIDRGQGVAAFEPVLAAGWTVRQAADWEPSAEYKSGPRLGLQPTPTRRRRPD